MFHVWTKPARSGQTTRPVVAVIDNDDALRRTALRLLRRLDAAGVGLLDTSAALRWLATSPPAIVVVDAKRVDAVRSLLPRGSRTRVVAIVPNGAPSSAGRSVDACLARAFEPEEFLMTLQDVLARDEAADPTTQGRGTGKKRVLLVDDDDDIRESFSILLEEAGYEVVPAQHGRVAMTALEGGLRPDVILLDLMMPVMNGHEVLRRLASSIPALSKTPVVIITAGTDTVEATAPVLRKPVDMNRLLATVQGAVASVAA